MQIAGEQLPEIITPPKFPEDILNNIPTDVAVFDSNHNYLYVNQQGIGNIETRKWIIGRNDFDYCKLKGIDDSSACRRRAFFKKAVQSKTNVEWIDEHITKEGSKKYILRIFHPTFDDENLLNVIGYGVDITAIKKAEQAKKEYIMALEEMMFITSHKIRQPISQIMGISVLLESDMSSQQELKDIAGFMQESIQNLDSFTRELTSFINDLREKSDKTMLAVK